MRAGLCCASETMGADGWPAADVARPVTDACERVHPPMESISAAWQSLTHTDGPDLDTGTETVTLLAKTDTKGLYKTLKNACLFVKFICFLLVEHLQHIKPQFSSTVTHHRLPLQTMHSIGQIDSQMLTKSPAKGWKLAVLHQEKAHLCYEACV